MCGYWILGMWPIQKEMGCKSNTRFQDLAHVWVFHCFFKTKNYHTSSGLTQPFIIPVFYSLEVGFSWAFGLESPTAKTNVSVRLLSYMQALKPLGLGQILLLWCRAGPVPSCPSVSCSSQLLKTSCIPCYIGPSIFKPTTQRIELLSCLKFLWLLFLSHVFCF